MLFSKVDTTPLFPLFQGGHAGALLTCFEYYKPTPDYKNRSPCVSPSRGRIQEGGKYSYNISQNSKSEENSVPNCKVATTPLFPLC